MVMMMMVVHLGVGEGAVGSQLLDGRRDSCLPDWRPENSSVGRDGAEEGEKENRKLEHNPASVYKPSMQELLRKFVHKWSIMCVCVCIMSQETQTRQGNNSLK